MGECRKMLLAKGFVNFGDNTSEIALRYDYSAVLFGCLLEKPTIAKPPQSTFEEELNCRYEAPLIVRYGYFLFE